MVGTCDRELRTPPRLSGIYKGPPAHPPERTYPCCIPALGEFSTVTPHGGSGVILDGRGDAATCWAELTMFRKEGRVSPLHWRIRIAAECARLESVYRETYRGFKSLILRSLRSLRLMHSFTRLMACLELLTPEEVTRSDILRQSFRTSSAHFADRPKSTACNRDLGLPSRDERRNGDQLLQSFAGTQKSEVATRFISSIQLLDRKRLPTFLQAKKI